MMDEGRLLPDGSGGFEYEYFLKDHLGNTRVSFIEDASGNASIQGEDHYYPFGMTFDGMSVSVGTENKYKYNGKELQDDMGLDWYDYGWRFYDAALGRWHVIDPLVENYINISPYVYVDNNPIIYIDPDGKRKWPVNKTYQKDGQTIKRRLGDGFNASRSGGKRTHRAIDYNVGGGSQDKGISIMSTHGGIVESVGFSKGGGYYATIISDDGNLKTTHRHLNKKSSLKKGAKVVEGQVVGELGGSGSSTENPDGYTPHGHFELSIMDSNGDFTKVDPIGNDGNPVDAQVIVDHGNYNTENYKDVSDTPYGPYKLSEATVTGKSEAKKLEPKEIKIEL